jgi:hypothetical protein
MEHDENAVINDDNGIVGHDEATVDVDPKETTPNPYVLTRNTCNVQLKQRLAEVNGSTQEL